MTEAAECIERAIALAQEQGDVLGLGMAYASYAAATFDLGRVAEALDRLESVFVARRALRDKGWPGNPYERCVQGACHLHLGQWAEAAAALTTAHDLSRHVGDRFDEASALRLRAELHRNLGRLDEAIDDAAHAVAIAKDLGGQLEVEALTTFGRVRHQASQLPAAITLLQRGRDIAQARRLRRSSAEAGVRLGDALISAQLLPAARAELDFVLLRCREYGYRLLEADATTALARLLLAEGDPAGAQRRAEQAVELHQCLGHVPGVAAAETVRATAGQLAQPSGRR
jgi:tetratricopeptide (TPR) repeat protein